MVKTSGANSTASKTEPMTGGYREDESGVMLFGGEIQEGGAEPTDDHSVGYAKGYKVGYDEYYSKYRLLTLSIYTGVSPPEAPPEAPPKPPTVSGAVEPAATTSGAVTTSGASKTKVNTEPLDLGAQRGGSALSRAKRAYKRGKTFTQHARLLGKIKDKTNVV